METEVKTGKGKKIGIVLGAAVLGTCGIFVSAYWYYSIQALDRDPQTFSTKAQWVLWGMGMKAAYETDTYGGATPEETLNMYIAALEAGNVELAAKYYIPEKWKEIKTGLSAAKEKGNLVKMVEVYKSIKNVTTKEGDGESYIRIEKDEFGFYVILKKNTRTNKWKIAEP